MHDILARVTLRPALFMSIGLVVGLLVVGGWWLGQVEQYTIVAIEAPQEPAQGLPIYAQYTVTQRLMLREPTWLASVRVPFYSSSSRAQMVVSLRHPQSQTVLASWRVPTQSQQGVIIEELLPLEPPQLVAGEIELHFDGTAITHEAQAPRIFIEPEDARYPHGNYRIAQNEKRGDVGLTLIAQHARTELLGKAWAERPWEVAINLLVWMLFGVGIVFLPPVIVYTTVSHSTAAS